MFRILVITISDGTLQPLHRTLDSLRQARVKVDGLSVRLVVAKKLGDKSDSLIRRYQDLDLKVISEKDTGIADGFNKGLEFACRFKAEYSHFMMLNAGDRLVDGESLALIERELEVFKDDRFAAYFGSIYNGSNLQRSYPKNMAHVSGINHIGLVQTIETVSLARYDTTLKTAMDYDYILKLIKKGVTFREYDGTYIEAEPNGISSRMTVSIALELRRIQKLHFYDPYRLYDFLAYYRICKLIVGRFTRSAMAALMLCRRGWACQDRAILRE